MKLPLFLTLVLLSSSAFAALPTGLKVFRYGLFVSQAESLWINDRQQDFGENGKTQFIYNSLSMKYGWFHGIEFNGEVTYANTEMKRGTEGGSVAGDKQSGISAIKLGTGKSILSKGSYSLEGLFEISHPFNRGANSDFKDSPDVFIARNDGSIHYSFGVTQSFTFNELFSATLQSIYIARDSGLPDQIKFDLFLSLNATDKISLGLALNMKDTLGGLDLGTPEFAAEVPVRSGGNERIRAFSLVNEEVFGASVFSTYQIDGKWSVDAYVNKKLDGRNTDVATSYGTGITFLMW